MQVHEQRALLRRAGDVPRTARVVGEHLDELDPVQTARGHDRDPAGLAIHGAR